MTDKQTHYTDPDFPPTQSSVISDAEGSRMPKDMAETWKRFGWLHWTEVPELRKAEVRGKLAYTKVMQGQINNCYIVDVLTSLALVPERIEKLLPKTTDESMETFEVNVYAKNQPTTIKVDGYFPYLASCQSLAFARSGAPELWCMILEKAWAKHLGSYSATVALHPASAFKFFTGSPTVTLSVPKVSEEELWNSLVECQEKKYPMVCFTMKAGGAMQTMEFKVLKLLPSHSYAVLEVKQDPARNNKKMVKLRNAWGRVDWSDGLNAGYSVAAKAIVKLGDGTFSVDFASLYKCLLEVDVCEYGKPIKSAEGDTYIVESSQFNDEEAKGVSKSNGKKTIEAPKGVKSTLEFELDNGEAELAAKLRIEEPCTIDIRIGEAKSPKEVIIGYQNPHTKEFEYLASEEIIANELAKKVNTTKPGKYFFFVRIYDAAAKQGVVSIYTEKEVELKVVGKEEKRVKHLKSVLRSCAVQIGKKTKIGKTMVKYDYFSTIQSSYASVLFLNFSKGSTMYYEISYMDPNAVKGLPPFTTDPTYRLAVPPGEESCLCLRRIPNANFAFTNKCVIQASLPELVEQAEASELECTTSSKLGDDCSYKIYQHDFGYLFECVNSTSDAVIAMKFDFALVNLVIEGVQGTSLLVELPPGETKYAQLVMIDPYESDIRYSLKVQRDSKKANLAEKEIIEELLKSGQTLKIPGKEAAVYSKYINTDYCLYVKNETDKILEATITFKNSVNMEYKAGEVWKVDVTPEEKGVLKIVKRLEPFKQTRCAFGLKYVFTDKN
eukprot:TRINITY_DN12890_c0_g1_i18.p1 TRINITY_DN12890_c0_g1~~TRINITY_DN12890_c0_g1_i18.p1  ORF type:complete len:779 (-),score=225.59 TRINITY_DN12890_c0_g1_i18:141-2477(-)